MHGHPNKSHTPSRVSDRYSDTSLVPRLLFAEQENSLVNCRFGSNIFFIFLFFSFFFFFLFLFFLGGGGGGGDFFFLPL